MQGKKDLKVKKSKRPGDWLCPLCHNFNFSFRVQCNRCHIQMRDSAQTQLFQQGIMLPCPNADLLDSIKPVGLNFKSSEDSSNSYSSEDEVQTDSHQSPSQGFTQALFVENLVLEEHYHNESFQFNKSCSQCRSMNYFYQSKCSHCQCKL